MKRAYEVAASCSDQLFLGYRTALSTSSRTKTITIMASLAERVTCDPGIVVEEQS